MFFFLSHESNKLKKKVEVIHLVGYETYLADWDQHFKKWNLTEYKRKSEYAIHGQDTSLS